MGLAGLFGVHVAACSDDTSVSPIASDGSAPVDAAGSDATSDAPTDASADAPFCPVGAVTGSCEQSVTMASSLYTRFCSDLIDTSTCKETSGGQGSGGSASAKIAACPTDMYLLGRCAYSTACRNDVNVYAYSLPGNPDNTVEKATATCTAGGGKWQELSDAGAWVTK